MRAAAALLLLAACSGAAETQPIEGASCRLPENIESIPARPFDTGRERDVPVTGYILALSWSPEFCARRGDAPGHALQCRDNRFGFVVHGLWPQGLGDRRPRSCAPAAAIDPQTVAKHLCMMPGRELIADQWEAHGTCGWSDPASYLAKTAELYGALKLPDPSAARTAGELRAATVALNPGLLREAVVVDRTRDGAFEELRICYDPAFRYRPCRASERGAPDSAKLEVTPR